MNSRSTEGAALARRKTTGPTGFGSSRYAGTLQKASLLNLARLAAPDLAGQAGVIFITPYSIPEERQ